jgi:hypothetical protein
LLNSCLDTPGANCFFVPSKNPNHPEPVLAFEVILYLNPDSNAAVSNKNPFILDILGSLILLIVSINNCLSPLCF